MLTRILFRLYDSFRKNRFREKSIIFGNIQILFGEKSVAFDNFPNTSYNERKE